MAIGSAFARPAGAEQDLATIAPPALITLIAARRHLVRRRRAGRRRVAPCAGTGRRAYDVVEAPAPHSPRPPTGFPSAVHPQSLRRLGAVTALELLHQAVLEAILAGFEDDLLAV